MASLEYDRAGELLAELFAESEAAYGANKPPKVGADAENAAVALFRSPTQSYREDLLGCGLARLLDRSINIRHPYMNQGDDAFNGRTLDERVVNPFLHDRRVPSSKGPYLAVFRRSVELRPETAGGLRDKAAGVGGDVTVREGKKVLLAIEVTERPIDKARVVSTFNTKIVEAGLEDYVFVYAHESGSRELALGVLRDICKQFGCDDPPQWLLANDLEPEPPRNE